VEEISQIGFTSRFGFPVYGPRQYVTCGYQDNLGFGFNTALGVKVANPGRAVVPCPAMADFCSACRNSRPRFKHRINLVTIVFNNRSFGNVRRDQFDQYGGRLLGADLVNPDFLKLAESFGALACAPRPRRSQGALERALKRRSAGRDRGTGRAGQ